MEEESGGGRLTCGVCRHGPGEGAGMKFSADWALRQAICPAPGGACKGFESVGTCAVDSAGGKVGFGTITRLEEIGEDADLSSFYFCDE